MRSVTMTLTRPEATITTMIPIPIADEFDRALGVGSKKYHLLCIDDDVKLDASDAQPVTVRDRRSAQTRIIDELAPLADFPRLSDLWIVMEGVFFPSYSLVPLTGGG